ncbi:MAG: M48 family metallopeptidase [Deltaproteobacteria bacterium]|nr:M48 family metallopeptidase [Deltaproteobacteria bacterium]
MKSPLLFIFIAYLVIKGIENMVAQVNLRHLHRYGHRVPAGFAGLVDDRSMVRIRDYTVDHGRIDFFSSAVDLLLTVIFIFGGLLNWYNSWLAGQGWPFAVTGICFFLFLAYGGFLLQVPFDLYNTFVVEEKYGFNRQTFRLWLADAAKGLLLTTVLYSLLLWVAFLIIDAMPDRWWLLLWAFMLVFKLFMLYISPYVIEPLFNKFTPIADKSLEEKIKTLLARAGLSVSRVFTMDASRRSGHGNAYFSGIGHVKRIVLFDTLLEKSSDDEILAILAHEAGHWKKKHILKRLLVMECVSFAALYAAWWFLRHDMLASIFNISMPTLYVKLLLVGFCGMLAVFPFKSLLSFSSRRDEWQADGFAVELTGNPRALASALAKLGRDNLANLHPHPWYVALHYSHPPLPQRVRKLLGA